MLAILTYVHCCQIKVRTAYLYSMLQTQFSTLRPTDYTPLLSCSASPLHTTLFYPLCTYETYWYTTVFTSPILLSVTLKPTLSACGHIYHVNRSIPSDHTVTTACWKNGVIGLHFAYRILQEPYYSPPSYYLWMLLCMSYHFNVILHGLYLSFGSSSQLFTIFTYSKL